MNYQEMSIDDIIKWCQDNNQVEWLKKKAKEQVDYKIYPKVKGEDGKMHVDKTQQPKIEKRPISFIQIKIAFVDEFMPEIAPKRKKKESMYDRIMAL